MANVTTKKKGSCASGCGGLIILGTVILIPLSLLVSLTYGAMARDSGLMSKMTTDGVISAIWTLAIGAAVLTLLWAWAYIWRKTWIWDTKKAITPPARRPVQLRQIVISAVIISVVLFGPAAWAANSVSSGAPLMDQARQHDAQANKALMAAAPACKGQGAIAGAGEYTGNSHPIAILSVSSSGDPSGDQSDVSARARDLGQLPDTLASVQLTACISQRNTTVVQTCDYSPSGTDIRYQYSRDVSICATRTGQLLERKTFTGSVPRACPDTMYTNEDTEYGSDVNWNDSAIWDYLKTWVSGSAKAASVGISTT